MPDKGEICTKQKCPKCHGKFEREHISTTFTRLICPQCQTQPTRFYLDVYDNGKRHPYISRDEKGRLLSSPDMANALLTDIRKNGFNPEKHIRKEIEPFIFKNFTQDEWLADVQDKVKKNKKAHGTYKVKERYARLYYTPFFGDMDIREIRAFHISQWEKTLDVSPNTSNNLIKQLGHLFSTAKTKGYIDYTPSLPEIAEVQKDEIKTMSRKDQNEAIAKLPNYHKPIFEFMKLTGCRPAMARALQWGDIEWDENRILFKHNFSQEVFTKRLKNKKVLSFPLISKIQDIFSGMQRQLSGFVFINETTGEYYSGKLNQIFRKACKKAKVKYLPPKNFGRASFITNLLDEGMDIRDVADLAGHGDVNTTRDFYSRVKTKRLGQLLEMGDRRKTGEKSEEEELN